MTRREPKVTQAIPPDPADARLFRDAVGPVRRLREDAAERRVPPPPPIPRQTLADAKAVARESLQVHEKEIDSGDPLLYIAAGVSPDVLRRLGRGEFSVSDEFDLHHLDTKAAKAAIARFLTESRKAGRLCVRIIHGKGLRSGNEGPVLKRLTDHVLRQRGDVLAFGSARPADGGTGAVVVLLRRI